MSTTIEQLELEIQSNSTSAVSGIDALSESLRRLKAATAPVSKGGMGLGALSTSLKKFSDSISKLSGLSLAREQIQGLVDALKPLENVQKSGFNSLATGLEKLVKIAPHLDTVTESLKKTDLDSFADQCNRVATAITPLATQMEKVAAGFSAFPEKIQRLLKGNTNLTTSNRTLGKSYVNLAAKISIAYVSIKSITGVIAGWITKSNDYVESLNLFKVSLREFAPEAQKYAESVSEIMGIDPAEWMRNQGVFMTITEGFGVASDRAYTMSKNLTQLGYDLSSFFNISYEDAFQKLQSGISGELEPLRRLGYDLSVARLQQEALNLGITKSVNAMTQAEKAELRYYAIMTQVTTAQGDMARTLEAPANQLRILKAQVNQAARALGNIFIPVLNKVLPYAIAVAKVIRMIADIISGLFGFSLPEFDTSGISSSVGGIADSADNIASGLGDAAKNAKELKNAMVGIDELNIISQPDTSGNDGAGIGDVGGLGGLGFELPTYDFISEATNSKVTEIVDKMKEWLGITGDINSWADLFDTRLGKILTVVGLIGGAFLLWKISKPFVSAFQTISSIFGHGKSKGGNSKGFSVPSPKSVLKGLADVAIIIGGIIAIVEVIGLLMQIPGFEQTAKNGMEAVGMVFNGLLNVIVPITAISAGIVALGKIGVSTVAKGFGDFAIIVGGASVLITAIGAFISIPYFSDFLATGVDSVVSIFKGLQEVALPIGALSAIMIALGIVSPGVILSGLAGFALVIGGVELVLVALGALQQIPGFSWIVGEGGKVLIQLGEILGGFAGSIVNGFLVEVSDSFPEIGKNLAGFMTEAKPFFDGLSSVNAESVDAVAKLAAMVLLLTAADVMDGLTSWITGGSSMIDFGKDICVFAPYLVRYSKLIKGIDGGAVQASAVAAKALAEFANNIPNSGGLAGFFAGENDVDTWGAKLPSFGRNLKRYSDSIKDIDGDSIQASATAAKSLAELANNLPNDGGVASWFTGENNIDIWGEKLPRFGKYFKEYSDIVTGVKNDVVLASSSAAKSIVEFANNIPNEGGVWSWFVGGNSIDVWGEKLPIFGKNFLSYYNYIKSVKPDAITATSSAIKSIVEFANNIPTEGGLWSLFVGNNNIVSFAENLMTFGKHFRSYYKYISDIETNRISAVSSEVNKILDWSVRTSNTDTNSIKSFSEAVKQLGSDFASCSKDIVNGFTDKISTYYAASKTAIISWGTNVKSWFTNNSYGGVNRQTFSTYGADIISGFKDKISSNNSSSKHNIVVWAANVKNWFTSVYDGAVNYNTFKNYAENVINGFNYGINSFYRNSRPYVEKWAEDVKTSFKDKLDEHSPSKEFFNFGVFAIKGFNNAIVAMSDTTKPLIEKWAASFMNVMSDMDYTIDPTALPYYTGKNLKRNIHTSLNNSVTIPEIFSEEMLYEAISRALSEQADRPIQINETINLDGRAVYRNQRQVEQAQGYRMTTSTIPV